MSSASALVGRRVVRMNGAGNKILVLDLRGGGAWPSPAEARAINRAPGLDYDQLMLLTDPRSADTLAYVPIYNNDGSLAEACGNGTRCVADRLSRETGAMSFAVETEGGLILCERLGEATYRVDMGPPRLDWSEIPIARPVQDTSAVDIPEAGGFGLAGLVNMGNPHAVFFVSDVAAVDLAQAGPRLEHHQLFPRKGQHLVRAGVGARSHSLAGLGARRRGDARLRLGGLCDVGRGGAARVDGPEGGNRITRRRVDHRMVAKTATCG